MNEKQQQLTFEKGITNVPSDAICSDNTLEESVGMIYEDGEHRVIQKPIEQMYTNTAFSANMLYIHKYNDKKRYIFVRHTPRSQNPDTLDWAQDSVTGTTTGTFSGIDISDIDKLRITSVGKTLIITDPSGMHYILWKEADYISLGELPNPDVEFFLNGTTGLSPGGKHHASNSQSCVDIIGDNGRMAQGKQKEYNDLIVGLYLKNKKAIAQKKAFCEPFFVRAAIELYDGTYTHITQPILLFPAINNNTLTSINNEMAYMTTRCCKLCYVNNTNLEGWSDIIRGITVFVTDGIGIYDLNVDQPNSNTVVTVEQNAIFSTSNLPNDNKYYDVSGNGYRFLKMRDSSEILDDIKSASVFYKLCEIEKVGDGTTHDISQHIDVHTLENITTRSILEYDDYFSRNKMKPGFIYSYNSRLNIANVERNFFEGFHNFLPYDNDTATRYRFYVTICTDTGREITVMHEPSTLLTKKQGIYFFYPDSRATKVMIFKEKNGTMECILNAKLEEHQNLNGAIYMDRLPTNTESESTVTGTEPTPDNDATELLGNYIIQSEVNNPWVFKAEGYYKVATGKISGMSTITQALSEGQYGQFPLLVFSESGIWSLSVASTGYYDSIHPMSREVCNNVKSITQTDGAVFFTSEKGLMVIVGNQVKCVSEQLSGKEGTFMGRIDLGNFHDFLKKCYIAYDYRDSLLWIFSTQTVNNVEVPYEYCWIYSIKSGTFGKYHYSGSQVVNDYPDYLISDYTHFDSLTDRPNINLDTRTYSGRLISRPMKLENALALKSIMQIKHIHDMNDDAMLTFRMFASNDLKHWVELTSLRGVPWKYYRFRYDFANLIATDRFAGTMLITQERRTNKMR